MGEPFLDLCYELLKDEWINSNKKDYTMNRRDFSQTIGLTAAAVAAAQPAFSSAHNKPKFYRSLVPGAIGVQANQQEAIDYAARFGFEGVSAYTGTLEKMSRDERKRLLDDMKSKNVRWGNTGLPVQFKEDERKFQDDIKLLPKRAAMLQEIGCTRVSTWIMPTHAALTYRENFEQHRKRLKACCQILADEGLRLGLEYIGPTTLMTSQRFPFVRSHPEMWELIEAIDEKNVGFLLDCWHWYTSHSTLEELKTVTNDRVIDVQVNDAPNGVPIDEQIDGKRMLPAASGVIDSKAFMQVLVDIGYDGPVSCEPFSAELNAMENEVALQASIDSLNRIFALVGA